MAGQLEQLTGSIAVCKSRGRGGHTMCAIAADMQSIPRTILLMLWSGQRWHSDVLVGGGINALYRQLDLQSLMGSLLAAHNIMD
jgi:hypothetical protein